MSRQKKTDPGVVAWTVASAVVAALLLAYTIWLSHHVDPDPPRPSYTGRYGLYP